MEQVTEAFSGSGRPLGMDLFRLRRPPPVRVIDDGWARACRSAPSEWVVTWVGSSIMTTRLGAIMVAVEATEVAEVSIGNRRSALDAKGGCRSMRTTPEPYLASARQRGSRTGGGRSAGSAVESVGPALVGARLVPISLSRQGSHSHHSWIWARFGVGPEAKN